MVESSLSVLVYVSTDLVEVVGPFLVSVAVAYALIVVALV